MKMLKYICVLMSSCLLSGCGMYSKYHGPQLDGSLSGIAVADSAIETLGSISWRELFTDSNLTALIDSGLSRNTDLRIASLKVEEASATLRASKLAFFPSANLGIDGQVSTNTADRFQIGPSASWEIDIFGKQRNLKLAAEAEFYASEAYKQAVQTSLVAAIADCYYTLLMLDEQLDISQRTIKTWDENIRVLQALKRAGRTNEAAVLQARANRLRVENSTLTLKNQINAQENAMRSLLLCPSDTIVRGTFHNQVFPDTLACGISLEYLSNRPDVREAEFELRRTFYGINVARSAFYPSLTLSGSAGWTTASGSVANASTWLANALGSITAPLFNRGTNKANLDIARSEYEVALLKFRQTLVDAGLEANDALKSLQTARERINIDKKQIVALKGAVHNTRLLMRNTNTNYLEVLTAQQRLLEAELTEATDKYDEIQSVISLYHALGGGIN